MSKLLSAVSVLAFGAILASSQPSAALLVGGTNVLALSNGGSVNLSCKACGMFHAPHAGETITLNPQPLPPGIIANGRMLRR